MLNFIEITTKKETGEFLVPLLPEQVQGMRTVVEGLEPSSLDEGFLSTIDAFMNKSHQDGMVRRPKKIQILCFSFWNQFICEIDVIMIE